MQLKMPVQPAWLRANVQGASVGVDREQKAVLGYVVAQCGPFLEPDPRGEFDEKSLKQIVKLMKANKGGTKVRLGHPNESDDHLSKYLGRAKNPRLDSVRVTQNGVEVELMAVRADLYLAESAFDGNPNGNLGDYILQRVDEDPDSLSSSLVLQVEEEVRLEKNGTRKIGDDGKALPPLWRPLSIHASDLVDAGAAVNGILSARGDLPDTIVRRGTELLDAQFAGQDREVVQARLTAFVDRYILHRFGEAAEERPVLEVGNTDGFATVRITGPDTLSQPEQEPIAEPVAVGTADDALLLDLWLAQEGD